MAANEKDDLAKALEAMSAGQVSQDDAAEPALPPVVTRPASPMRPASPLRAAAPSPAASPASAPPTPRAATPVTPVNPPSPSATPQPPPPRRSRPASPVAARTAVPAPEPMLPPTRVPGGLSRAQLESRRTFIPILLTCGVLCVVLGAVQWIPSIPHPLAHMPGAFAFVLPLIGLLLLGAAVLNMAQVAKALAAGAVR